MDIQQEPTPFSLQPEEQTDTIPNVQFQKIAITVCIIIVLLVISGIFLLASKSNQSDTTASAGNQISPLNTSTSSSQSVAGASTNTEAYGPPRPSGGEVVPTKKPVSTATTAPIPTVVPTGVPTSTPAVPTATPTPTPTQAAVLTATPTPTTTDTPTPTPTDTP